MNFNTCIIIRTQLSVLKMEHSILRGPIIKLEHGMYNNLNPDNIN